MELSTNEFRQQTINLVKYAEDLGYQVNAIISSDSEGVHSWITFSYRDRTYYWELYMWKRPTHGLFNLVRWRKIDESGRELRNCKPGTYAAIMRDLKRGKVYG